MGYYDDDKRHPVRTSKKRPKLDAPITVREYTTDVRGLPAIEKRKMRRFLETLHAANEAEGKGGWLRRFSKNGRLLVYVSEMFRVNPEQIAGGQKEDLEERVQRLERKRAEKHAKVDDLQKEVKALTTQVGQLREQIDLAFRGLKFLTDRLDRFEKIDLGARTAKKKP